MKPRPRTKAALTSVDGVNAVMLVQTAKRLASAGRGTRLGISHWDASGIFGDLETKGAAVERPSVRTLLLLYAADLAFRLRWEIRPALAAGRTVIAAPYVDTAIALGRAAGIDDTWLRSIFDFAPVPAARHYVDGAATAGRGRGLIEFACRHLANVETRAERRDLMARAQARLKATRHRSR
jgi:hypothetical protein